MLGRLRILGMLGGLLGIAVMAAGGAAATLQVGPTRPYTTPQAAMTAAQPGDVIEIDPGLYSGAAQANLLIDKNVVIRGVPGIHGKPQFDCQDTGVFSIGCWVVHTTTTDVTIENVEIYNFRTPASASCIRVNTPGKFTLRHSVIHDCQQGVLSSNQGTQQFFLDNNTFYENGTPGGQTHNVYIGESAELVFIRNRSYNSRGGQLIKTRSKKTVIAFNDVGDPRSSPASNYEIDISCGGDAYVVGNKIHQARGSTNQRILFFGPEACQSGPQRLSVIGNTVYNEAVGSDPVFVQVRKQAAVTTFDTLVIEHNIMLGPGLLFRAHDANLTPDLTTNSQRALPEPPLAFVGPPEHITHSLTATGVLLTWALPPGATGAVVRRGGQVLVGSAAAMTDAGPHPPGTTLSYELRSLQGTAESAPAFYTVLTPLPLPSTPTAESFAPGWYEVPNSRYQQVYAQPPPFATRYLVEAWSGGAFDPEALAFYLFGGGSPDYSGNELLKVPLLGAPSVLIPASTNLDITTLNPAEGLLDGKPAWRHSYGGLAYATQLRRLFVFGGQIPRSVPSTGLWSTSVDCPCSGWERLLYTGDTPEATYGANAVWNPVDGQVWIKTMSHLYSYDPTARVMTKRNPTPMVGSIYFSATVDTHRNVLVLSDGMTIREIPLGTMPPVMTTIKTFAPEEAFLSAPGLAYDSDLQRVVLWSGGARFGVLTGTGYSERVLAGGPGAAVPTGTYDRFMYVPVWQVFTVQNAASQNLFVVKVP